MCFNVRLPIFSTCSTWRLAPGFTVSTTYSQMLSVYLHACMSAFYLVINNFTQGLEEHCIGKFTKLQTVHTARHEACCFMI